MSLFYDIEPGAFTQYRRYTQASNAAARAFTGVFRASSVLMAGDFYRDEQDGYINAHRSSNRSGPARSAYTSAFRQSALIANDALFPTDFPLLGHHGGINPLFVPQVGGNTNDFIWLKRRRRG